MNDARMTIHLEIRRWMPKTIGLPALNLLLIAASLCVAHGANPNPVGTWPGFSRSANELDSVALLDNHACLTDVESGLHLIDIMTSPNPVIRFALGAMTPTVSGGIGGTVRRLSRRPSRLDMPTFWIREEV